MHYKIYCDLDGVLVDFERGYHKLTGIDISNKFSTGNKFWEPLDKAGEDFWVNLEWTSEGKRLWKFISSFKPIIISAPSREKSSRIGKEKWVKRELRNVPLILCPAHQKQSYADERSILIDDRVENCEQWAEKGGIAILHRNEYCNTTIDELYRFLYT
jgi:hypothetical protein